MAHPLTRDGHLARMVQTKPTQQELETACTVLRWLSDHAYFFPEEYDEGASVDLAIAADACAVTPEDLMLP